MDGVMMMILGHRSVHESSRGGGKGELFKVANKVILLIVSV